MGNPVWLVNLIKKTFPARFTVADWTHIPVIGKLIDRWLFWEDDTIFLPRDAAVERGRQVLQVQQPIEPPAQTVLPSQVMVHFIERANYLWIMDTCFCREAEQCKDYPIDLGCLFMGEAVLRINPKLGHLATKQEALDHVQRCREAGLIHLIGRNKIDTVWMGVKPGGRLLTVCHCCPCCCLWQVLPRLTPEIRQKFTRMPGVRVTVTDRCVGCGKCTQGVCFLDAIHLQEGGCAEIAEECVACGRCAEVCPESAIEVSIEDDRFIEKAIARLSSSVDVS
jgi:ferredoxin